MIHINLSIYLIMMTILATMIRVTMTQVMINYTDNIISYDGNDIVNVDSNNDDDLEDHCEVYFFKN